MYLHLEVDKEKVRYWQRQHRGPESVVVKHKTRHKCEQVELVVLVLLLGRIVAREVTTHGKVSPPISYCLRENHAVRGQSVTRESGDQNYYDRYNVMKGPNRTLDASVLKEVTEPAEDIEAAKTYHQWPKHAVKTLDAVQLILMRDFFIFDVKSPQI